MVQKTMRCNALPLISMSSDMRAAKSELAAKPVNRSVTTGVLAPTLAME